MRGMDVFNALNNIDDGFIAEADNYKRPISFLIKRAIGAAACFAVCITVFHFTKNSSIIPITINSAPLIQQPLNTKLQQVLANPTWGGMGFEGLLIKDSDDLGNSNPWKIEKQPKALPVYKNERMEINEKGWLDIESKESVAARATEMFDLFKQKGLLEFELIPPAAKSDEIDKIIQKYSEQGSPLSPELFGGVYAYIKNDLLTTRASSYTNSVHSQLILKQSFLKNFLFADENSYNAAMVYLQEKYINKNYGYVIGDDYTAEFTKAYHYGNDVPKIHYSFSYYKEGADYEEQIVNYFLKRKTAYVSNYDNKFGLWDNSIDLSSKLGDYPTISPEEAAGLLRNGEYYSTVPHQITETDNIIKVELCYRNASYDPVYLPYYRFYVDVSDETTPQNYTNVGAYYVPAIEPQYLKGVTIGISFNGNVLTDKG